MARLPGGRFRGRVALPAASTRERTTAGCCRDTGRAWTCSTAPSKRPGETSISAASICSVRIEGLEAVLDRQTLLRPSDGPTLDAEIEQRRLESEDAQRVGRADLASPPVLAGDFNMPVDSAIYRRYWAEFPRCVLRCRPGIRLYGMAADAQAILRRKNRPRLDGARLAVPPLLGRAGRGLRPSSPAGRTLAPSGGVTRNDNRSSRAERRKIGGPRRRSAGTGRNDVICFTDCHGPRNRQAHVGACGDVLERAEAIRTALSLGMPLHEIEEYLDWLDATRGPLPDSREDGLRRRQVAVTAENHKFHCGNGLWQAILLRASNRQSPQEFWENG